MTPRLLSSGFLVAFFGTAGIGSADVPAEHGWRYSLSAATVRLPQTGLDSGGKTRLASYHVRGGVEREVSESIALGLKASYDLQHREFSGAGGLAGLQPWGDTGRLGITGQLTHRTRYGWSYGLRPFVSWASESGDLDAEALSYGASLAVAAGFSSRRHVGIGAQVARGIDDEIDVSPLLIVDWALDDNWTLRNPRETSFIAPAGLELVYRSAGDWRFAVAGVFQSAEFRLDESRAAPGGIGKSEGFLSFVRVTRRWPSGLGLNIYLGAIFDGELSVEDATGTRIAVDGYDTAPLAALSVEGSF